jgi:hypothetical protein
LRYLSIKGNKFLLWACVGTISRFIVACVYIVTALSLTEALVPSFRVLVPACASTLALDDGDDKFVKVGSSKDVSVAFGPPCVVISGWASVKDLNFVDTALDSINQTNLSTVPIVVLP